MNKIIEIKKEVKIGNTLLAKGTKIKVLKEEFNVEDFEIAYKSCISALTDMDFSTDDRAIENYIQEIDHTIRKIEKYMDNNNLWISDDLKKV